MLNTSKMSGHPGQYALPQFNISKMSDPELARLGTMDLISLLRQSDRDRLQALREHKDLMADLNQRMQVHLMEVRGLKEVNQRLQDDNQELRDLCCFLDDDRQKGRKLAREWQRFGRYTSGVMKSEVLAYQQKLKELESKQEALLNENLELKELCLFLDQESQSSTSDRDQGDGSSNTTPVNEEKPHDSGPLSPPDSDDLTQQQQQQGFINEQTLRYIRQLEGRIARMEEERSSEPKTVPRIDDHPARLENPHRMRPEEDRREPTYYSSSQLKPSAGHPDANMGVSRGVTGVNTQSQDGTEYSAGGSSSKPEAVVHAMKVLEVHEKLERPYHRPMPETIDESELGDTEKAIVREMCNVVWRKLGDYVPSYK